MNQTEQLQELQKLEENANMEKNNKNRYLLFQQAADGYVAKEDVTEADLWHAYLLYEGAFDAAQMTNNSRYKCQALIDLGSTSDKLGITDKAINFYQDALGIALSRKDKDARRAQNRIYTKLAIVHTKIGNYDLADYYYEQANATANVPWRTEEQTSPKLLAEPQERTRSNLPSTSRTRKLPDTELMNQVKQVEQINEARRILTLIVGVLLFITLVIISTSTFISPHSQVLSNVFVIVLITIFIITLIFHNRILALIYHEDKQD